MLTHVKSMKTREEFQTERRTKSSRNWYFSVAVKLVLMAGILFVALNFRIHYSQKAEQLNAEAARVRQQIHELDREIETLKKRKETLSSYAYIMRRNNTCRLGLRPADPGQIRRIALLHKSAPKYATVKEKKQQSVRTASLR